MNTETKSRQEPDEAKECRTLCCSLPEVQERDLSHISDGNRLSLIRTMSKMWVNGTNLTYFFHSHPTSP